MIEFKPSEKSAATPSGAMVPGPIVKDLVPLIESTGRMLAVANPAAGEQVEEMVEVWLAYRAGLLVPVAG